MNRNEWGEFFLDFLVKLLLSYAAKHSADAAQEALSKVSLAVAQFDTQKMSSRARPLLPVGEAKVLTDPRTIEWNKIPFGFLEPAKALKDWLESSDSRPVDASSGGLGAGVITRRSDDTAYVADNVHTDWRSDIHPIKG